MALSLATFAGGSFLALSAQIAAAAAPVVYSHYFHSFYPDPQANETAKKVYRCLHKDGSLSCLTHLFSKFYRNVKSISQGTGYWVIKGENLSVGYWKGLQRIAHVAWLWSVNDTHVDQLELNDNQRGWIPPAAKLSLGENRTAIAKFEFNSPYERESGTIHIGLMRGDHLLTTFSHPVNEPLSQLTLSLSSPETLEIKYNERYSGAIETFRVDLDAY